MRQAQITGTEGCKHIFGDLHVGLIGQLVEIDLRQVEAIQFALQQAPACSNVLVASLQFEPMDDLCPCPGRGDVAQVRVQPVAARSAMLAGDDLNLLASLQAVVEGTIRPLIFAPRQLWPISVCTR